MVDRLTVVFEDESIYRRLKMRAVAQGLTVKRLVEEALREYLGPEGDAPRPIDWDAYERWQDEVEALNAAAEPIPFPGAGATEYGALAEERVPYNYTGE